MAVGSTRPEHQPPGGGVTVGALAWARADESRSGGVPSMVGGRWHPSTARRLGRRVYMGGQGVRCTWFNQGRTRAGCAATRSRVSGYSGGPGP